jgi:hypothetical protein
VLSRYVYWPRKPEYAVPWILGPLLFLLLGTFDLPGGKPFGLGSVPASLSGYFLAMLLLTLLNGLFLWIHVRPQFLTWRTGCRRFFQTLLLLTVGHILVWGAMLLIRGHARFAYNLSSEDWSFTVKQVDLALLAFGIVLLSSAVWKTEEPGLSNFRLERDNAQLLTVKLRDGTISGQEFLDLAPTLKQMEESARPLAARLSGPDLVLLQAWRTAGKVLCEQIENKDVNDIELVRSEAKSAIDSAAQALARVE